MCHHEKSENLNLLFCLVVKAKTVEEVVKNRPVAGILDTSLAVEYKVIRYFSVHQDKLNCPIWIAHFKSDCYHTFWPSFLSPFLDHSLLRTTISCNYN